MSSVTNDAYSGGTLQTRDRTHYEYDSKSYRVRLSNESDTVVSGVAQNNWTADSSVEFLADHHNHTGYAQTIRETTFDSDGTTVTKTIDYTFGHDEISQTVDDGTTTTTHVFGHDGHGSVRVLFDLATTAANMAQAFSFAAYGEMLGRRKGDGGLLGRSLAC